MAITSWFNKVRSGAINNGVIIEGLVHKASPVAQGKTFRKGTCPKCGSNNGFVFRSHMDGSVYILFCQKCKKYSWKHSGKKTGPSKEETSNKCQALTKSGNRCSYNAAEGSHMCTLHNKMAGEGKHIDLVKDVSVGY